MHLAGLEGQVASEEQQESLVGVQTAGPVSHVLGRAAQVEWVDHAVPVSQDLHKDN